MTDTFAGYTSDRSLGAKSRRRAVMWAPVRPHLVRPKRGIVTFTFDDFPKSAVDHGAPVLDRAGLRGTFYACAGNVGTTGAYGPHFNAQDIIALEASGHEIGCHTVDHVDCARIDAETFKSNLARNADQLAAMGLKSVLRSFAYPYGEANFATKRALPASYSSGRGIFTGLNVGLADFAQLRAQRLYGEGAMGRALSLIAAARVTRGWAILFTHDVSNTPSAYGCTPGVLEELIAAAGDCDILPMREACAAILGSA
jgi:peptidoglycan/xylan/chitin deacetylase (PgdA/CDA1 family)